MKPQFLDLYLDYGLPFPVFQRFGWAFGAKCTTTHCMQLEVMLSTPCVYSHFLFTLLLSKKLRGFIWGSLHKRYNGSHRGGFQRWEPPCIFLRSLPHAESNRIALLLIFVCMHAVREISFDSCTWSISQMFRPELPERSIGYYLVTSLVCAAQLQFLFCTTISLYCNGHCNSL